MKWIFLLMGTLPLLWGFPPAYGQPKPGTLPPLQLTLLNEQVLTNAELKKQPTLIMYFSPTCDHCIHQMKDMQKQLHEFRHIQVVMATYQPLAELQAFVKEYALDRQPNFITGRDSKFLLPPFYKIQTLPYFALYNKKGQLITTFQSNVAVDKLLSAFGQK